MIVGFLGTTEIVVILVIALLVFGPQKLPEVGKQIGSAYRELNRVRNEVTRALEIDDLHTPNRYDNHDYNQSYPNYNTENTALPAYGTSEYSGGARTYPYDDFVAPPGPKRPDAEAEPGAVSAVTETSEPAGLDKPTPTL